MSPKQLEHVARIAEKYAYGHGRWNKDHAEKVSILTQRILQQFANLNLVARENEDLLLARAIALPHDIGRNPNAKGQGEHNQRSFETLKEELSGSPLNEDEVIVIQYCALFHTGGEWRHTIVPRKPELTKRLAGILRIADSLDYSLSQEVQDVVVTLQHGKIIFKVIASGRADVEMDRAREKSDLLKDVYGLDIEIV